MGSAHRAHCGCGFETEVTVGGTRASFLEQASFPFYCDRCGIVEVNIANLKPGDAPYCPECSNPEVHQYGKHPASVPVSPPPPPSFGSSFAQRIRRLASRFGLGRSEQVVRAVIVPERSNRSALQWRNFEANKYENRCPSCKQMTLVFDQPSVMFD